MKKSILLSLFFFLGITYAQIPDANGIIYVKAGASGNGRSWANAHGNLQAAIDANGVKEVWVAEGTYKPAANTYFKITDQRIKILGGFPNKFNPTMTERNWLNHKTVLQGNGNSVIGFAKTYHPIKPDDFLLDGFIITDGTATDGGGINIDNKASPSLKNLMIKENNATSYGGGIHLDNFASPLMTNVTISNNSAVLGGGGVYFRLSNAILDTVIVSGNTSDYDGGGLLIRGDSNPIIRNTVIKGNYANVRGGGVEIRGESKPIFENVSIVGNISKSRGGGVRNSASYPTFTNVIISGNQSLEESGGGISNEDASASIRLQNVLLSGNTAKLEGGAIYSYPGVAYTNGLNINNATICGNSAGIGGGVYTGGYTRSFIYNSIILGNSSGVEGNKLQPSNISNSLIQIGDENSIGRFNESDIADSEVHKIFIDPTAPRLTQLGDYRPKKWSFAINKGDNSLFNGLSESTTDLDGNPRVVGDTIDLGAYEATKVYYKKMLYVREGGTGDGKSWNDATADLQGAIEVDDVNLIWVAAGTYKPKLGESFSMKTDLEIYGGFPKTGNPTMNDRDWVTHETILKANGKRVIHNNDSELTAENSLLDGFTITNGQANGGSGGGILNVESSPKLANLKIIGNIADGDGGGMYNEDASPILSNVLISQNTGRHGGGMANYEATVSMTDVSIITNTANGHGGGIYNSLNSNLILDKSNISKNATTDDDYYYGGGIYNEASSAIIRNTTISENYATYEGGGIYTKEGQLLAINTLISENNVNTRAGGLYNKDSQTKLINLTIASNTTGGEGGGIYNVGDNLELYNCIVLGNEFEGVLGDEIAPASSHNLIQIGDFDSKAYFDGLSPTYSTAQDVFVNPYIKGTPHQGDYNYSLRNLKGNPAIDKGMNAAYTDAGGDLAEDLDLAGNARLFKTTIDLGAYEYKSISSTAQHKFSNVIQFYPNPTQGELNLTSEQKIESVCIYDVIGTELIKIYPNSPKVKINLSSLPADIYFANLVVDGVAQVIKLVKL